MAECAVYSFKLLGKREIRRYKGKKNWEPYVMEIFTLYGFFVSFLFLLRLAHAKYLVKTDNTRKRNNT